MIISIPGDPIPLQRHRSMIKNGKICTYDPQLKEKINFQKKIREEIFKKEYSIEKLLSIEYYVIRLDFAFGIPNYKKSRTSEYTPHSCKPDLDNLIKFTLDVGNGLLWSDDKKIIHISAHKYYSLTQQTVIEIQ